jgi:hypothetical protein
VRYSIPNEKADSLTSADMPVLKSVLDDVTYGKLSSFLAEWTKTDKRFEEVSAMQEKAHDAVVAESLHQIDLKEAQQRSIEERRNLAHNIFILAMEITECDSKFLTTEVVGWRMQASKFRGDLNALVTKDRPMLTPQVRREVEGEYQRVLPGLTVWQANHLESVIESVF